MDWTSIIKEVGVIASIALFLVWCSWKREIRLSDRVTKLEMFVQEELIGIVRTSIDALRANTEALKNLTKALESRPCMYDEDKKRGISDAAD